MQYRTLGRTGLRVSEIGLGCEGFNEQDQAFTSEMFQIALAAGVNCMDLYCPNPTLHEHLCKALQGNKEKFILQAHLCAIWQDGQYKCSRNIHEVKAAFEAMLHNLEFDAVDIGMIHYVDSTDAWSEIAGGEIMRYARS